MHSRKRRSLFETTGRSLPRAAGNRPCRRIECDVRSERAASREAWPGTKAEDPDRTNAGTLRHAEQGWRLIRKRLDLRSVRQILTRMQGVARHYGTSGAFFRDSLKEYLDLMDEHGITPTLPVTASVVERYPGLFRAVRDRGAELAIHGYRHIDYTDVPLRCFQEHVEKSQELFTRLGIPYTGFRFPYLRKDARQIRYLRESGFEWDSSEVLSWNSWDPALFSKDHWRQYMTILETYDPMDADAVQVLPRQQDSMTEIPVSVPDDDILIGRLGLQDGELLRCILMQMYRRAKQKNGIFVVQAHPERFAHYRKTFARMIHRVQEENHAWVASLRDIADWWRNRCRASLELESVGARRYRVRACCEERMTVLIRNAIGQFDPIPVWDNACTVREREWEMESPKRPVIGAHPSFRKESVDELRAEGYVVEISEEAESYSVYLSRSDGREPCTRKDLRSRIEETPFPLLRFWLWPRGTVYAFSVTGDIDAVDLRDYWSRFHG